jgi:phospholipid/cholesterol/gamma-HCH transport system substrate-binding protein
MLGNLERAVPAMTEPRRVAEVPFAAPEIPRRNPIEPLVGALVLIAVAFMLFAGYVETVPRSATFYALNAWFSAIDGLQPGCDVRIGGVKVGEVVAIAIDPKTYLALITLNLNSKIKLPADSVAAVSSEGLLAGKYLELLPGASDEMLKPGARIYNTKAPVSLFKLLGQFLSAPPSTGGGKEGPEKIGTPVVSDGVSAPIAVPAGARHP